jgi:hypothetical protein
MLNGFMSVDTTLGAGRAFLRSLYEQYAAWGVDLGTRITNSLSQHFYHIIDNNRDDFEFTNYRLIIQSCIDLELHYHVQEYIDSSAYALQ